MKWLVATLMALMLLTVGTVAGQYCPEFTRNYQVGLLPIGTIVDIVNYEWVAPNTSAPVTRTGTIDEYFITTNCPQNRPFFMDAQAYVIQYGAADGSRRIVSFHEMTVR
jgi:hypothetical protein